MDALKVKALGKRQLFLQHVAQTSPAPLAIDVVKASGCTLWDADGKTYTDLIAGISVCNIGHCHPAVVQAVKEQAETYMHLLVYGELVQTPQVAYAELLANHLPAALDSIYFTNSGAEATEGAMKLAKRVTGRTRIIAFNKSYHGSTQGALSMIGDEYWRNAYRPLLPDILHLNYNEHSSLEYITEDVAAVFAETIQAESGVHAPSFEWMQALREKCTATGTLLVLDEIQAGFGRTGTLWAFEQYGIVPDILLLGKALGGGMPLGAFVSSHKNMWTLTENPVLGHITTFGGHPVCCAAGYAGMKALIEEGYMQDIPEKEALFLTNLKHPRIKAVRSKGLWLSIEFDSFDTNKKVIDFCIENGVLTDWFLFAPECLRIGPPLSITEEEIVAACEVIVRAVEAVG
ncbi:aspartate aminotransferase family protein [Parasegetibacter sp. NRK P23]|uniref:aspartate aminotransferase family protein n=1 Tax=Parasegetibacter sp. NRK P23 TaxID=2942999 RepID=UPI0020449448|nr:aminotransferase class III-fold pyridoxal phosphate-dependent enzyme [Parasegetibacter sp. NRK P23]MCM5530162.1 aminotransferase class III-fold pyridoxal phosphate-dependent enzyme [Parasegetibacter sp. NRK P23]